HALSPGSQGALFARSRLMRGSRAALGRLAHGHYARFCASRRYCHGGLAKSNGCGLSASRPHWQIMQQYPEVISSRSAIEQKLHATATTTESWATIPAAERGALVASSECVRCVAWFVMQR